jgi:hypothetical protein
MRQLKTMQQVTAYYTGGNGTYCSVAPTAEAQAWITKICEHARLMGFDATGPLDQHVTVLHSKRGLTLSEQNELPLAGLNASRRFNVKPKEFIHWEGHDSEGYVVLELESPELTAVNAWLRSTFNMPVSFDDYRPHVTIATNAYSNSREYAQSLCDELNRLPRPENLVFTGLRVEDLK